MIPKKVMILGEPWKIVIKDIPGYEGLCDREEKVIYLDPSLSEANMIQTYLHEIFHAIWHRVSLNQTNIDPNLQEIIVDNFATWLAENYDFS